MEISLITALIAGEVIIILLGLSITFGIMLLRKPDSLEIEVEPQALEDAETELDTIDLGNSYIDFLEQEIDRNSSKQNQQENIEADIAAEAAEEENDDSDDASETEESLDEVQLPSPAPDEAQSSLLQAREHFLQIEKDAAEKSEHEINFWESIYGGMISLIESLATHHTVFSNSNTNNTSKVEGKDKVFYIETQGKKIDGEVNKLKDIIFEQENALSSMMKALKGAEDENPEDSGALALIREQLEALERQISDSKMCMDILEMENNRLQEEVDKMELDSSSSTDSDADEGTSTIDLDQMKEIVDQQNAKIEDLLNTIETLEIDADQAERLKDTIGGFARTSQEMMGCIAILEEENERLKASENEDNETTEVAVPVAANNNEEIENLKSSVSALEEEIIKKDVAFAQLQDEFSSMETEYLAMYEAMHGDNS